MATLVPMRSAADRLGICERRCDWCRPNKPVANRPACEEA